MKLAIFCGIVAVAVLAGNPASAQVPLVIYDNFETKVLSPDKWFGKESSDPGVFALESGRQIKTEPLYGFKGLDILNRSYASEGSDSGRSTAFTRLLFADGSKITTIKAVVLVKKIQETGCSTNAFATNVQLRIGGAFFNAGPPPTPGDQTNDVFAFVVVRRAMDSTNPSKVLNVEGRVFVCNDANCNGSAEIGSADLGTLKVNQKTKVLITWDQVNNMFVFQKGNSAAVNVLYTQSDTSPPGTPSGGNKRLEVLHLIPNCTSAPRPMAYMEAFFDNIKVNASAVP